MKRNSKSKYRYFLVQCQNGDHPTLRVWAGSFVGAMRAAYGPADYRIMAKLGDNECEMRCPFGRAFVVKTEK